jgi:2-dehydropantoate 2-reductase
MRRTVAIVGTGAVGGWYAGLLALAGHRVRCLARRDAGILSRDGLALRSAEGERRVRLDAVSRDPADLGASEVVIVAGKATANRELPALAARLAAPGATLVTLQNGMGNAEALAEVAEPGRVVAGLCFVCINRTAPGVVENTLPGHVRLAAAEGPAGGRVRDVAALFAGAGVDARAEDSLESVLWRKLCWNIPFNGLSIAAGGLTTDRILADPALRSRALRLMLEVRAAAEARGVPFGMDHIGRQFAVTEGMGPYRTSSLIDFAEGREVEVDPIWRIPLARGRDAGVQMPELEILLADIEARLAGRP